MQLDKELFRKIDYNNLRILAKYLRENVSDKQFDMENYRADSDLDRINTFDNLRSCGTVGCAMGWAPYAFNMSDEEFNERVSRLSGTSFYEFWSRLASDLFMKDEPYFSDSSVWHYLFDGEWSDYDNTRSGAIERLELVATLVENKAWHVLDQIEADNDVEIFHETNYASMLEM